MTEALVLQLGLRRRHWREETKFELVINIKTAKSLGIKISDNMLSLADSVIE
jgi:hypothetical protein